MTRLQQALQRLYLPQPGDAAPGAFQLLAADGSVRALVLELHGPADWAAASRVWQGVQADLAWPAPGIAVSGTDGYQLWFSLQQPVPAAQAAALLDALRLRYLADIPLRRLRWLPGPGGAAAAWQPGAVPAPQADAEHWSAFVSQDLAPMFEDTPWLDMPPNPDGQAGLLAQLRSISPGDFQQALETCGLQPPSTGALQPPPATPAAQPVSPAVAPAAVLPGSRSDTRSDTRPDTRQDALQDPRQFLLSVMQDASAPLALRIEAARALLPQMPGS